MLDGSQRSSCKSGQGGALRRETQGKYGSHMRKWEWFQVERDWGSYGAARTNKGWMKRENRAGDGNRAVPWETSELFIHSELLSRGDLGRRREGGDGAVWMGDAGTHMEHPESLSRAELFQELIPQQTTVQFPEVSPWVSPMDGNLGSGASQEVKSS